MRREIRIGMLSVLLFTLFSSISLGAWLNVSYQSPVAGSSQIINQNNTFNVSMNVTCIGDTCGNVTGVLRYNKSSNTVPDATIEDPPFGIVSYPGGYSKTVLFEEFQNLSCGAWSVCAPNLSFSCSYGPTNSTSYCAACSNGWNSYLELKSSATYCPDNASTIGNKTGDGVPSPCAMANGTNGNVAIMWLYKNLNIDTGGLSLNVSAYMRNYVGVATGISTYFFAFRGNVTPCRSTRQSGACADSNGNTSNAILSAYVTGLGTPELAWTFNSSTGSIDSSLNNVTIGLMIDEGWASQKPYAKWDNVTLTETIMADPCGVMAAGQTCQVNWTIKATGTPGAQYFLDANFTSNETSVPANDSGDFQINITTVPVPTVSSMTTNKVYYINGTDASMKLMVKSDIGSLSYLNASITRPDGSMASLGTLDYNATSGLYEKTYTFTSADRISGDYRVNVTTGTRYINYTSFYYVPLAKGINNIGVLTSRAQIWDTYRNANLTQMGFAMNELMKHYGFLNSYLLSPKLVEDMNLSNFSTMIVPYLPSTLWTENLTNKLRNFSNNGGLLVLFGNLTQPMWEHAGVKYNTTLSSNAVFNLTRTALANESLIATPWRDTDYLYSIFNSPDKEFLGNGMLSFNMSASNCVIPQSSGVCTSWFSINYWPIDVYNTTGAAVIYNMANSLGTPIGVGISINGSVIYSPIPVPDVIGEGTSWMYNNTASSNVAGGLNPTAPLFDVLVQIIEKKLLQNDTYVRSWFFPEEAYSMVTLRHDDACTSDCAAMNNSNMAAGMRGSTWIMYSNNSLSTVQAQTYLSEGNEIGYHVTSSTTDKSTELIGIENAWGITVYSFSDHGDWANDHGMDALLSKMSYRHGPTAAITTGYYADGGSKTSFIYDSLGRRDTPFIWWNQTTRDVTMYPRLYILGYDNSVASGNSFNSSDIDGINPMTKQNDLFFYRRNMPIVQLIHPDDVSGHTAEYDKFVKWFAGWYQSNGNYTYKELRDWYDRRANVSFYVNYSNSTEISFVTSSPALVENFTWIVPWKSGWNTASVNIFVNGVDKTTDSRILNASLLNGSKDYLMFLTNVSAGESVITIKPPADNTPPNIAGWSFNVSNMTNYSSTQGYQFNATVNDSTGISYFWIEHNFTGTMTNNTVLQHNGNEYYYDYGKLAAGYYYVKWYANDSNGNLNNSDWVHYYQVNKSYMRITLYINGTNGDLTLFNNSNANFTANFSSSYGFAITLYTNLTGTMTLWDTQNSPLRNYTALNPYQARTYLIKANFSNQNYTYSQANHTLNLSNYGWLNVSYQSPANGSNQKVSQYDTFNVSMNVTCVSGDCGSVTGVLRYNASSLNPDTNVSTTNGTTPFYVFPAAYNATNLEWVNVANTTRKFTGRNDLGAYVFNNSMWVIGGQNTTNVNDVWYSNDGANWTRVANTTPMFSGRSMFGSYVFNNSMWVIGGSNNTSFYNDVWYSSDGASWTQVANTTPVFIARYAFESYVFNNSMWVIGGTASGNKLSDVWYSSDGASWTNVTNTTSKFNGRAWFGSYVFNNSMWVVAGIGDGVYLNDVWRSSDGANWTRMTNTTPTFTIRGAVGSYVYNNSMWVIGGSNSSDYLSDVWKSFDYNNPGLCGSLSSGQTCQLNWIVNATGTTGTQYWLDANFTSSYSQVPANDSGDFQINITSGAVAAGCAISTPTILTANLNCPNGLNITNPGILTTNGWNVAVGGNIFVEGRLNASGTASIVNSTGRLIVSSNANVTQGTGLFNFSGGYLQNGDNSSFVQGGTVYTQNFNITNGTFTGGYASPLICSGNFTKSGGTFTGDSLYLYMTGTNVNYSSNDAFGIYAFRAGGTVTRNSGNWMRRLMVDSGANLINNGGLDLFTDTGHTYSNNGTITGPMSLNIQSLSNDRTIIFGVVSCPVSIRSYVTEPGARTLSLGANTTLGSSLTVISDGTTGTMTLAGNGYNLTVNGSTTLGKNGTINQGSGTLNLSGLVIGTDGKLNTSSGAMYVDAISGNGNASFGSGVLTKNTQSYWNASFDSLNFSFASTVISYGNNTGTKVIDARTAVDGGNNVPTNMWKFTNLIVSLVAPENGSTVGASYQFTCSATDDVNLINMTLYHNNTGLWVANQTNSTSGISNTTTFNVTGLAANNFVWNCYVCDSFGCFFAASNYTATVDLIPPNISFVPPTLANATAQNTTSVYVNVSVSDSSNTSAFIDWNNNLVGWWRFNNATDFRDYSSYGNNGTNYGTNYNSSGKFGGARQFDGVSSYIKVTNSTSLNPKQITMAMWLKFNNIPYTNQIALNKEGSYRLIATDVDTTHVSIRYATTTTAWGSGTLTGNAVLQTGRWYYIVATYNKTSWNLYLNGQADGSKLETGDLLSSFSYDLFIGSFSAASAFFNGTMDEVTIYNRSLSPQEVNASYNAGLYRLEQNFTGLSDGNYTYTAYAQDLAGNVNQTETRTLVIDTIPPNINFTYLTDDNLACVGRNWTYVNTTISDSNLVSGLIDLDNSLVGWWRFDGNAKDYTNLNNASAVNAVYTSSGKFGGAYSFNGSNEYIYVPNSATMNITGNITVSMWLKVNSYMTTGGVYYVLAKGSDSWGAYYIKLSNSSNIISFSIHDPTSQWAQQDASLTGVMPTGQWHQITGVWEQSNNILKIYYDGVLNNSVATTYPNLNESQNAGLYLGCLSSGWYFSNVSIDDVKIHNRALSLGEISASYNAGVYRLERNFTGLADGSHNFTAYAQDSAGNINQTETRTITVDTTGPNAPNLISPANYSALNISTPTFNWTASTDVGCSGAVSQYNITIYSDSVCTTQTQSSLTASTIYTATTLSDGNYSWNVKAKDSLSNWGQTSACYRITIDTVKPFINFTAPTDSNGACLGRNWTYVNTTISDANLVSGAIDFDNSLVGWYRFNNETDFRDYSSYGNNGTNYGTNYNSSGKFGGARQFNGLTNFVNSSISSKDNSQITISSWAYPTALGGIVMIVEQVPNQNNLYIDTLGGGNYRFVMYNDTASQYTIFSNTAPVNLNTWTYVTGTWNTTHGCFYINGTLITCVAGNPYLNSSKMNKMFIGSSDGSYYYFNGTIDDVKIHNRALSLGEISASYNAGVYRLERNFTGLADGSHNFTAYAQDAAGNVNQTETRTITVDTTGPNAPTGLTPANNTPTNNTTPTFSWSASTDVGCNGSVTQYNATIYSDTACTTQAQSGFNTSTTSYTASALSPANYTWNVKAKDGLGNWGPTSACYRIIIDTVPPVTNITAPADGSWQNASFDVTITDTDTLSGINTSGCFYRILSNGTQTLGWTVRTCNANVTINIASYCTVDGQDRCRVEAYAKDIAGNIGNATGRNFSIIGQAPSNLRALVQDTSLNSEKGKILLTWTDNTNYETGFLIERGTNSTLFGAVGSVSANVNNFTDDNLNDSTTYYYRVRANYSDQAYSQYSNVAKNTTYDRKGPGTPVLNVTPDNSANRMQLNWSSPKVAVVYDSECGCAWTVGNCHNWWLSELQKRGINATVVNETDIDTVAEMKQYDAIFNPYGEYIPETSGTTVLDTIRYYVAAGGYWFESGGFNFYYSCGGTSLYGSGDDHVCTSITGNSTPVTSRTATPYKDTFAPNGPATIGGEQRPSIGMAGSGVYDECSLNPQYYPLYNRSSAGVSEAGPAMHCFGLGCIVRTDNTDTDTADVFVDILRQKFPVKIYRANAISGDYTNITGLIRGNNYTDSSVNDTAAPNTPAVPAVKTYSESQLNISWDTVTDNGTAYYYYVVGYDEAGNENNLLTYGNLEKGILGSVPTGWESSLVLNETHAYSGDKSGLIVKLDAGELTSQHVAVPIPDNKIQYRYGGCIYSDGPSAEIFFFSANTTNFYDGTYDNIWLSTTGQWTCINGTSTNVKTNDSYFALRVDNNGGGRVWFENLYVYAIKSANVTTGIKDYYINGTNANNWNTSTNQIVSGLTPNTNYCYSVKARDNASNNGSFSGLTCNYTGAETPSISAVTCGGTYLDGYHCNVSFSMGSNPAGTEHYINETTGSGDDQNWNSSTSQYRDFDIAWNTQYCYQIKARNANGLETSYSSTVCKNITDNIPPLINFTYPTDPSGLCTNRNSEYVNVTVSDTNLGGAFIDWNRSLVGWWRFNGASDFTDYSSYGNNGTNYGSNYTSAGKLGGARVFNGSSNYIDTNNDTLFRFGTSDFSISAWIKTNVTGYTKMAVGKYGGSGDDYWLGDSISGSGAVFSISGIYTVSSVGVTDNNWHHLVGVRNGTNIYIYVDGVLSGNTTNSLSASPTGNLRIGRFGSLSGYDFNGTIDEVQIYKRALSTQEINASFNAGTYRLYHNFTDLSDGNYTYTAYAQDLAGNVNSTEDRLVVIDTKPPNIASFKYNVTNMTNYSAVQGYQFNVTVTDNIAVDDVWIEHNFTGTMQNVTVTTSAGNEYFYNYGALAVGYYYVKWYANDTVNNKNNTDYVHYYQVNKSYLPMTLYISGTDGDKTLYNNSVANFTANFSSSYGFAITLYTNLTGTMTPWDTQNSPLRNYTALNPYRARTGYLIKANWTGNQNYTYSQANHSLTLANYGWLNVSYQSPANGSSQNVYQYDTFNVSMNVTCVGGDCGNVTGVLRYNKSSNTVPDAAIENPPFGIVSYPGGYNKTVLFEEFQNLSCGAWSECAPSLSFSCTYGTNPKSYCAACSNDWNAYLELKLSSVYCTDPASTIGNKTGDGVPSPCAMVNGTTGNIAIMWLYKNLSIDTGGLSLNVSAYMRNYMSAATGIATYFWGFKGNVTPCWGVRTSAACPNSESNTSNAILSAYVNGPGSGEIPWTFNSSKASINSSLNNITIGLAIDEGWAFQSPNAKWDNVTIIENVMNNSCGAMAAGQTCQLNWTVNATGATGTQYWLDVNFTSSVSPANDSGDFQINITNPWLDVTLVAPPLSSTVFRYRTFDINVTVACLGGNGAHCNDVMGYASYNLTSNTVPNVRINTTAGHVPFYNFSGVNPYSCPNLTYGQSCNYSIRVNATGEFQSEWLLNVTFNSTQLGLPSSSTPNFKLVITSITGCNSYYNCNSTNCLYYNDEIITIQTADSANKVGSTIRRCWS